MRPTHGALVTGLAQGYRIALSFASGILLARLLSPEDFGLIALITPVIALVGLVQDLGLNQATIQRDKVTDAQTSVLFWITVAVSATLGATMALCGPLLAGFFEEPRLVPLAAAFGGLVVVWSIQSQPMALLARRMHFGSMAIIDVAGATAGALVGIFIAYTFRTYWALFASMLTTGLIAAIGAFAASRFRPGRPRLAEGVSTMLRFGTSVSLFNLFNYLDRNADNLLIGRFYGVAELGLYDRAYKLLLFPLQQVRNPLSRIVVPYLSRNQNDGPRYRLGYVGCLTALLTMTQPPVLMAVIFAPEVFLVLLGPQWLEAAPIFFWLGIVGLQQVMTSSLGWLFLSQGRGRAYLVLGVVGSVIAVSAFLIGLADGALGVARAYAIADTAIKAPIACYIALRAGPVRLGTFIRAVLPHMVALAVTATVLVLLRERIEDVTFLVLAALGVASCAMYGAVLFLWGDKRALLVMLIQNLFARPRADTAEAEGAYS